MKLSAFGSVLFVLALYSKEPSFLSALIDPEQFEPVSILDLDREGRLNVLSWRYWHKVSEWTKFEYLDPRVVRPTDNCTELVTDVNQDGYLHLVATEGDEGGIWYDENPTHAAVIWKSLQIIVIVTLKGSQAVDTHGDGTPDVLPSHPTDQPVYWIVFDDGECVRHPVDPAESGHGMDYGDVDGDKRKDILWARGWHRQINHVTDEWEFHPDFHIDKGSLPLVVFEANGDSLEDVIYGEAHRSGDHHLFQDPPHCNG